MESIKYLLMSYNMKSYIKKFEFTIKFLLLFIGFVFTGCNSNTNKSYSLQQQQLEECFGNIGQ